MAPCTHCAKNSKKCVVSMNSSHCSECIHTSGSVKCNIHGPSESDWAALEREEKKLTDKWCETQTHLMEIQSKLLRLDRQCEMFRAHTAEMLRQGLKSLDELDTMEEEERQAAEAPHHPIPDPLDTEPTASDDPFSDLSLDPALAAALSDFDPTNPFWASLGVGGGTPQASQGT